MKVTSVKIRYIQNSHIFCIASVTLDNQLIINDIKIYRDNVTKLKACRKK